MISGKVALGGLSLEFGDAERRFAEATREVEALTRAQGTLLDREKEILEALARSYLPELSPGAVSAGLDALRGRMEAALADQAVHRRALEEHLATLPEDIARREHILAQAERTEERAAEGLEQVKARVERELGADEEHRRAVAEHRAVMERRSILSARRARLQTTANIERRAYEQDPVFSYLLRRGFGEPGYGSGFLTRWLDARLAERSGYATLLRNYRILRTGPHAIQAEMRRLTERAQALEREIDERERAAGKRLGLIAALEAHAATQRGVVDAREALTEARALHDRLAAEIRAVDANRGRPYEDAIAMHHAFLAEQPVAELDRIARSTADPRDDALVAELDEVRRRLDGIGRKLARLRTALDRQATRTTSLAELVRGAFSHFTSRRSHFPEELNLGELVSSILDGGGSAADALRRMEASHRKRPLLVPSGSSDFEGWFAELSSKFDSELGAVEVRVEEDGDAESEVVVYDHQGRVLHRRVTRRKG